MKYSLIKKAREPGEEEEEKTLRLTAEAAVCPRVSSECGDLVAL